MAEGIAGDLTVDEFLTDDVYFRAGRYVPDSTGQRMENGWENRFIPRLYNGLHDNLVRPFSTDTFMRNFNRLLELREWTEGPNNNTKDYIVRLLKLPQVSEMFASSLTGGKRDNVDGAGGNLISYNWEDVYGSYVEAVNKHALSTNKWINLIPYDKEQHRSLWGDMKTKSELYTMSKLKITIKSITGIGLAAKNPFIVIGTRINDRWTKLSKTPVNKEGTWTFPEGLILNVDPSKGSALIFVISDKGLLGVQSKGSVSMDICVICTAHSHSGDPKKSLEVHQHVADHERTKEVDFKPNGKIYLQTPKLGFIEVVFSNIEQL